MTRNFAGTTSSRSDFLYNQHFLLARVCGQFIWLDHHLDPLQVRREAVARPRLTCHPDGLCPCLTWARVAAMPVSISEDKGLLFIVYALRSCPFTPAAGAIPALREEAVPIWYEQRIVECQRHLSVSAHFHAR